MTDDTAKSTDDTAEQTKATQPKDAPAAEAPKIDWADPNVPAGNSPPLPHWPLVASALAFGAWMVFLVVMAVIRFRTTQV